MWRRHLAASRCWQDAAKRRRAWSCERELIEEARRAGSSQSNNTMSAGRVHSEDTSSISQLLTSEEGPPLGGSTIERCNLSTATSEDYSSARAQAQAQAGEQDESQSHEESGTGSTEEGSTVTSASTGGGSHGRSAGPAVPELTPVTRDAYGGGLYGKDEHEPAPGAEQGLGRASDFQSAEGLAEDMPKHHVEHEPPSTGDRGRDITGQSYIQ